MPASIGVSDWAEGRVKMAPLLVFGIMRRPHARRTLC